MEKTNPTEVTAESTVAINHGVGTHTFTLAASNNNGKLHLDWSYPDGFPPFKGRIVVYTHKSGFPPYDAKNLTGPWAKWTWDTAKTNNSWDTGLEFNESERWDCAYIAENNQGTYVYIVKMIAQNGE